MLAAPLLTRLYLGGQSATANPELATALAYLLLPQIFFYGLGALLGAILNTRGSFGAFAWAPVLNNVVVLVVLGVYALMPGEISLDPVRMGEPKLLVLGIGTTLGIVVQALVLLPALRRTGFVYRPRWGWDPRLSAAGGLVAWVIAYVLIGIPGYMVTTRVAAAADPGGVTVYANAWLLLQVPYGVLGVSLLTALMPRMSRAAADGRLRAVVDDLSLGSRLSAVFLVPLAVLLTVFGAAGRRSRCSACARATSTARPASALAVACSAFGLLPYAITMLQLRVFYAMTDSRTPTFIQLFTVAVKIPLLLVCPLGAAAARGRARAGRGQRPLVRRGRRARPGAAAPAAGADPDRRRGVDDRAHARRRTRRRARRRGRRRADPVGRARPARAGVAAAGGRGGGRGAGHARRSPAAAGARARPPRSDVSNGLSTATITGGDTPS